MTVEQIAELSLQKQIERELEKILNSNITLHVVCLDNSKVDIYVNSYVDTVRNMKAAISAKHRVPSAKFSMRTYEGTLHKNVFDEPLDVVGISNGDTIKLRLSAK